MATYNTYKSAQNNGFTGSYDDWVKADRPTGSTNAVEQFTSFPKLTYTDSNGMKRTFDPNGTIQTRMQRTTGAGNTVLQAPDQIAFNLSRIDMLLDPNFGKEKKGYSTAQLGDVNFRSIEDVDFTKFDDPEMARKVITSYLEAAPQIGQNIAQKSKTDPAFLAAWNAGGSEATNQLQRIVSEAQQDALKTFSKTMSEYNNGDTLNTGGNNPNVTGDQGTISEQNKTGVPYPTWAEQQRAQGLPSSYQDWLKASPTTGDTTGGTTGDTPADTTGGNGSTGATGTTPDVSSGVDNLGSALDIINNSDLPPDVKSLFNEVVKGWNPDQEINMQNVLTEFNNIKQNTIDPYFAEQVTQFTNDLNTNYQNLQNQRAMELETERANAGSNIRQARGNLEASGMTFTGQGIEQLGGESAYAKEGGAIPTQTPVGANEDLTQKQGMTFQDGRFYEGSVNQGNRLMSSSSLARYQNAQNQLGRQAEYLLGSQNAGQFGLPVQGDVTQGSLYAQRDQRYGDVLSGLAGQNRQNNSYQQPYNFNLS